MFYRNMFYYGDHGVRVIGRNFHGRFHLFAPDYPGFGQSESPSRDTFEYTFDHLAEVMDAFLEKLGIDKKWEARAEYWKNPTHAARKTLALRRCSRI